MARILINHNPYIILAAMICFMSVQAKSLNAQNKQLVRLALIEVDSSQLDKYNVFLKEEVEASIRLEPGVITLYGVSEALHPERVTLFETYADSSQYKAHLQTPHFLKYKKGTSDMVKHLELMQVNPIFYVRKKELSPARAQEYFIRLIKIEIDESSLDSYEELAQQVMLPGIRQEPGLLVMYAVAEKNNPTHIKVLEVYADKDAYDKHLKTPHFLKYKEKSTRMVKKIELLEVKPIYLGAKP